MHKLQVLYTFYGSTSHFCLPLLQAMDGFLIVLDKDANILYVSETITGYVGLSQVNYLIVEEIIIIAVNIVTTLL